jgi:hypothetical protein
MLLAKAAAHDDEKGTAIAATATRSGLATGLGWRNDMPGQPILTITQGGDPAPDAVSRVASNSLDALRQMALKGAVQKAQWRAQGAIEVLLSPDWEHGQSYAAPLSPLRTQDNQELAAFFDRGDINTIEDDVLHMLDRLSPEPCWEDDPFQFLGEFV